MLAKKVIESLTGKSVDTTPKKPAGMRRAVIEFLHRVSTAGKHGNFPAAN